MLDELEIQDENKKMIRSKFSHLKKLSKFSKF